MDEGSLSKRDTAPRHELLVPENARKSKVVDTGAVTLPPKQAASAGSTYAELDRTFHAAQGEFTQGASPLALWLAWADWAAHSANAPFRRAQLAEEAVSTCLRFWGGLVEGRTIEPGPGDHRFTDPGWRNLPFSAFQQAFLAAQSWTEKASTGLPGVAPDSERIVNFAARQVLDAFSPSNVPWLNPEVIAATWAEGGMNFVRGAQNYWRDVLALTGSPSSPDGPELRVGRDLAVTPGKVVFRNALIELIQYSPQTDTVRPEPVLIVPAWIMKYYILDLSPRNSLIRYLVASGYTVFCISWRNPGPEMRDTSFDDYRREGFLAALDAVTTICPDETVHACGYCLGGTLLAIGAAAMARDGDDRLASITLFCAQTDFTEAGELQLFTTEDQVAFLEDVMSRQGYLDGRQMGGAFQLLRSRDLIWSRVLKTYWLGKREHPNDLMTWNEDATRMPFRMHSDYLRSLFLRDDLAEGRFKVDGRPIAVRDIRAPFFVVGTETDHVAPWRSVYKIHLLNDGEVTFVLTTGGHNAGIVSEPGHPHRSFHIHVRPAEARYIGPDEWLAGAERRDGSWWPAWVAWLDQRSGPRDRPSPGMGAPAKGYPLLGEAPGQYVLER